MEVSFNNELGNGLGDKILALTKAGFKVSDLIPDILLREKIKSQTLNVYKLFFSAKDGKNYPDLLKELDILDSFLFLAGQLDFIKEDHLKTLRNGFLVFKSHIVLALNESPKNTNFTLPKINNVSQISTEKKQEKKEKPITEKSLNDRQEKIVKYIQEKKETSLANLIKLFPDLSDKTVRNDLSFLVKSGKVDRLGKGNYHLVRK